MNMTKRRKVSDQTETERVYRAEKAQSDAWRISEAALRYARAKVVADLAHEALLSACREAGL